MDVYGGLQLSFLNHPGVLADTIKILEQAGCDARSLEAFHHLTKANHIHQTINEHARAQQVNGYLELDHLEGLMAHHPPSFDGLLQLGPYPARHSLMCFDLALLVLRQGPVKATRVVEDFGSKHVLDHWLPSSDGIAYEIKPVLDFAFYEKGNRLLSPVTAYRQWTGMQDRSIHEEQLAVSLRAARAVPGHYANSELVLRQLFRNRVALWQRDGLEFSDKIKVVLAHYVDLRRKYMAVDHIGLAVQTETHWMYLEKNGTTHPIVRINFPTVNELVRYVSSMFDMDQYDPYSPLHNAAYLVTLNNELHWIGLRKNNPNR